MPSDLGYAQEKFFDAVCHMASSPDELRERLRYAYVDAGVHRVPSLPAAIDNPELHEQLARLHKRFDLIGAFDEEGSVAATLQVISDADIETLAELVVAVWSGIQSACEDYPNLL